MKILFVTKEIPYPVNNGYRTRTFSILKGLAMENEVILACFGNAGSTNNEEMKKIVHDTRVIKDGSRVGKIRALFALFCGLFSTLPYPIKKRYSVQMKEMITNILKDNSVDLVICDSIYQALNIPSIKCKKVLLEHNVESTIIRRYIKVEKNILKKIYATIEWIKMNRYENTVWGKFDHVFAVSENDKKDIVSRIKRNTVSVIPNGVDVGYFQSAREGANSYSLVYTGQMNWYPNQDAVMYFLDSTYPLIKKSIPTVSLYIVGDNPPESIKRVSEKDKSVIVTGFVEDVRGYMEKGDVFIVPLRIGGGTRLKILEAMSMAKPVVSTSIGCEGLGLTNEKNIFIADEPDDFASKVVNLLNDSHKRTSMGKAGRDLVVKEYSWDIVVDKLNKTIKGLA